MIEWNPDNQKDPDNIVQAMVNVREKMFKNGLEVLEKYEDELKKVVFAAYDQGYYTREIANLTWIPHKLVHEWLVERREGRK